MAIETKKVVNDGSIPKKEVSTGSYDDPAGAWWRSEEKVVHKSLIPLTSRIQRAQRARFNLFQRYFRMYDGRNVLAWTPQEFTPVLADPPASRVTLNVIQSTIDTVTSKISKNRPQPMFLTEEGEFSQIQRAKRLSRFVRGVFYANDAYTQGNVVFRTGGIVGTGSWKVSAQNEEPKIEYVFPLEVLVDDEESFYGEPQNRYQVKIVPKDVLIAAFPDHRVEIAAATGIVGRGENRNIQYIRVVEAWHLPSGPGAKDGRRVIAIENADLEEAKWIRDYFPFVDFSWSKPIVGFWGRGLCEELEGLQVEINRLLMKIERSQRMFGFPMLLVPQQANISEKKFTNAIGQIFTYSGNKAPTVVANNTVAQEIYAHLDRLYERAFEIAGVSRLSATSQKPAGLDSGVALREYNDIETERFMTVGQAYEQFFMDTSKQIIDVMDEIEKESKGSEDADAAAQSAYRVKDSDRKAMSTISWEDAKMDEETYVLKVWPVSSLPSSPAGKLQAVMERIREGLISKEVGMALLDFPDISSEQNVELAMFEDINWTVEQILDGKAVDAPDAMQNLDLGVRRMRSAYLNAKRNGAPESVMEALSTWMTTANEVLLQLQQPELPQQGAVPPPGEVTPPAPPPGPPIEPGTVPLPS